MREKEGEKTKVDFGAKKTDAEWQETLDEFWKKATPRWFQWLEWVVILGVLTYVGEYIQDRLLLIVSRLSYFALLMYVNSFVLSIDFYGFPWVKSEGARRTVSFTLSLIIAFVLYFVLTRLVSEIQGKV